MSNDERQTEAVEDETMLQTKSDPDRHAPERLLGLKAQLALPELRGADGVYRKPAIEVEIEPGVWKTVNRIEESKECVIVFFGFNGHAQRFIYWSGEGFPRWRRVRAGVMHGFGVGCA